MLQRRRLLALTFALAAAAPFAAHGQANEKKKGGGISFVQFQTLTATVFRGDGRRGVLTVEAGVDVADAGLRARVNISQPLLRAAYIQFLQSYAGSLSPGAPPNADYLSQQLQQQTNMVLGRPGAKLLLGTILIN
jgi:flagellar basal body-associated protein FliL